MSEIAVRQAQPGTNHQPMNLRNPHGTKSFSPLRVAWQTGRQAYIQNQLPILILWLFTIALVLGYFFLPSVQLGLEYVGRLKSDWGWKFSAVSTALFGGTIPVLAPWITGWLQRLHLRPCLPKLSYVVSSTLFWAFKGVEIDFLYRLQAALLGTELNCRTVIVKTAIDQLLYVPAFGLLNVVLFYLWRDADYSFDKLQKLLGPKWYRTRILPVLISNWAIWIPAVALIYCLPTSLQLPIQNLVLCFWATILVFFTSKVSEQ
ncbi:Mpv17/PMP22 family protein [Adhaeretor mobilis]|uniref:Uncharacterized protein n=1 Tax=Adhaeretor mobilis TaxID=1930276 RepID=A0A517MQL5_9BACT|nr:Mpv17/PMP22 family protein [Adhaeretor mobilis]QDS97164.1 hypothetical protein HG15A2_04240 [Adhaeretor mobilis]